jgi:hypothetical protein
LFNEEEELLLDDPADVKNAERSSGVEKDKKINY